MGCAQSIAEVNDLEATQSREIDERLKKERQDLKRQTKMLCLGAGESGKSTVIKQLKLLHQGSYTNEERYEYREVIVANTLQSMQAIVDALPELNLRLDGDVAVAATTLIQARPDPDFDYFRSSLLNEIVRLTRSRVIHQAITRRKEYQLNDSAEYYFEQLDRMADADYLPSDDDILRARVRTTGVIEHQIKINNQLFKITDVGGQKSERRKWLNIFENIEVLLYVVALSEYDGQALREDKSVSRLEDAFSLFAATMNSRWFEKSTLILFLNKMDLFAAKLPREPLSQYIEGYPAEKNLEVEVAARFLRQKFLDLYKGGKTIYPSFTTATEKRAMKHVLDSLVDSVLKQSLSSTGLL